MATALSDVDLDDLKFRVEHSLRALGHSQDAITQSLLQANCRGRRRAHDRCPLALWLKAQTGEELSVGQYAIFRRDLAQVVTHLSDLCRLWLEEFDNGSHPELDLMFFSNQQQAQNEL